MNGDPRASPWPIWLVRIHAGAFFVFAGVCYLSPERAFGDAAWHPLARLAVRLVAAALVALGIVLIGAARSGHARTLRLALLAALVVDVQVPLLLSLHPAVFDYVEGDIGLPWPLLPLGFVFLVALTAVGLSSLRLDVSAE